MGCLRSLLFAPRELLPKRSRQARPWNVFRSRRARTLPASLYLPVEQGPHRDRFAPDCPLRQPVCRCGDYATAAGMERKIRRDSAGVWQRAPAYPKRRRGFWAERQPSGAVVLCAEVGRFGFASDSPVTTASSSSVRSSNQSEFAETPHRVGHSAVLRTSRANR